MLGARGLRLLKLYTFALSNFCEKARWALDRSGEPYREIPLVPGAHILTIRRRAKRTTVPLLEDGSTAVQGSQAIVDYLERRGLCHDFAAPAPAGPFENEAECDRALGNSLQTLFYHASLPHRRATVALWSHDCPAWAPHFLTLAYPFVAGRVRQMYRATPDGVVHARRALDAGLDACDAQLGCSAFLGGNQPSRWDLCAAALLAPLCRPRSHPLPWPDPPEAFQSLCREVCTRPTLQHVARLYSERRAGVFDSSEKRE